MRVSPSSLQLLVVSFIVWGAGVSVTRSWLWSIRGVLSRPKYNNTGGLSVKIFLIPGFYRPKYQNTGGSPNISPWLFGGNSDKPPVLEKKPINPWYSKNSDKSQVLDPIFFGPWLGPTLMARGSVGALRLAAARPRDQ